MTSVHPVVREVSVVCAGTGYFSEAAVTSLEAAATGSIVYCAIERQGHQEDLERKSVPEAPPATASVIETMAYRLKTEEGHRNYKKRKETIEPAFGIIKSVLGFRQFLMRGLEKVGIEWDLVTLAYNFKRLHRLEQNRENPLRLAALAVNCCGYPLPRQGYSLIECVYPLNTEAERSYRPASLRPPPLEHHPLRKLSPIFPHSPIRQALSAKYS